MTALAFAYHTHQCARCQTQIPTDRTHCYFCAKRIPPEIVASPHPEVHVPRDLLPMYDLLLQPLTLDEIAARLGAGWTRRMIETAFHRIRNAIGLTSTPGRQTIDRIALVRVSARLDECWCRR